MRILLTIPHFYLSRDGDSGPSYGSRSDPVAFRLAALKECVLAPHRLFGPSQCMIQLAERRSKAANRASAADVIHVVICTTRGQHLVDKLDLDPTFFHHHPCQIDPPLLGYECRTVLRDRWGNYDWYGFLEDDLVIRDPLLLTKLNWFLSQAGEDAVLLPNRYEIGSQPLVTKAYVDGDLREETTAKFQNRADRPELSGQFLGEPVKFIRPLNPHSGFYFLSKEQMAVWARRPDFLDQSREFVGPLESAASLGVMKTFRVYKPAIENANFLEIEHQGDRFLKNLRRRDPDQHPSPRAGDHT